MDTSKSLNNFYDKLEELEEKLVEGAINNSMSWFKKKKMGEEVAKHKSSSKEVKR